MTDERDVHELLGRLVEVAAEDRVAWLAHEVPADAELRARLLAAAAEAAETMSGQPERFLSFAVAWDDAADGLLGQHLGPYRIERLLADQGGMGTVYRGARIDGVFDQEVAIKVIARGRETEAFLQRFTLERRVLG